MWYQEFLRLTAGARQLGASALIVLASILCAEPASADAIVMTKAMTASTIAEIFVEESEIRVELEIGAADLPGFHNLLPDEILERMNVEHEPLAERLPRFFAEDLVIRADGGPPLPARVLEMEGRRRVRRDEITGEPMAAAEDEGEAVIFAVFSYALGYRPAELSVKGPQSTSGQPAATIGFVLYHRSLPVTDFRYLGVEETVDLDWADPWFSKFRNRNLRRQYDSPLNVFLYVEPYEVRVEVITRPADVQQWVDIGLSGEEVIPIAGQERVKADVAAFLADHVNLTIDGEEISPVIDRVNFLKRTLRTSTVISPPQELDVISATLGVIFVVPTTGYPEEAAVTWDLFSPKIQRIPGAATDEAGPLRFFLQPDDNVLWWKNFLKNPTIPTLVDVAPPAPRWVRLLSLGGWLVVAVLLVFAVRSAMAAARQTGSWRRAVGFVAVMLVIGSGTLALHFTSGVNDQRAEEIVSTLLLNVYHAFDFRDEELIYDTLAHSVHGDLLTDIYLETRRGLELASQGGARAKVKKVEMLVVETTSSSAGRGFSARCTWNVSGSVGHWGHIHQRTNQYVADLLIEPVDGAWKVTGLEVLEEERL